MPRKKQKTQKEEDAEHDLAKSAFFSSWEKAAEAAKQPRAEDAAAAAKEGSTANDEILNDALLVQQPSSNPILNASMSVDFLPRRLESIAVSPSPKRKRIKRTMPEPSYVPVTNLQDLPPDLLRVVLAFLTPNLDRPVHSECDCALVGLSRVSKSFRALALDDQLWYRVCERRWKTKVGFTTRMADAEAKAKKDTDNTFVKGGYWYRKFFVEERDAARTTITREELYNTTFTVRLWFSALSYPPEIKKTKGIVPSGLDGHSLSDTLQFFSNGTVTGLPGQDKEHAIFAMNEEGSIISIGATLEQGNHSHAHYVHRRNDWGWELRSQVFAIRSLSCKNSNDINGLWSDYASNLWWNIEERVLCVIEELEGRSTQGEKYRIFGTSRNSLCGDFSYM